MTNDTRARFAAAVRDDPVDLALACLLVGAEVDPELDPAPYLAQLDELAAAVDLDQPPVEALRLVLAGFTGDAHDYGDLRSSLLHEVLRRRAGLPILLSVVWLEVARRRGIAAYGVGLPGHYIVRVAGEYVDPFAGGAAFDVSGVPDEHLRPWEPAETLLRILTNIRVWAAQSHERSQVRLWAIELSLLLPHHPVELRLERAAALIARADYLASADEFEVYADAIAGADADAALRARLQGRSVRARLN